MILGAWRLGAVYQPLFTAFGPKAIQHRLETSRAKLVVTNSANRPLKSRSSAACQRRANSSKPSSTSPSGHCG
ncbi:AMP-binding protein [Paracoccus mutanolyticus]